MMAKLLAVIRGDTVEPLTRVAPHLILRESTLATCNMAKIAALPI
jgi:hypothetical protein